MRYDTQGRRAVLAGADRVAAQHVPGMRVDDVDVERLSPLGTDHITLTTLTGRYRIALPDALRDRGGHRELNTAPAVAA